ncbi:RadC family protein [Chitinophaga niabensis]|uniref:DNA replication and repair protein RadC n=1 Tax=Chitinophaga niabensis TaxID=536979 RepID=A0A1N6H6C1_9BACT|nr:DNA repair protein RadC [Chitinophaga niabensis]SIO15358.1 DNA replication and repair protein RadC [Chitinophaga niabensis]
MIVNPTFLPGISNYLEPKPKRVLPPIHEWSEDDQPRKKLVKKGARSLSQAELLAILINCGNTKQSAIELAQEILLSCNNNLSDLSSMNVEDLTKFHGIGYKKAVTILASLELSRRKQSQLPSKKNVITCADDVASLLRPLLEDQFYETFYVLYLNHANKLLHYSCISSGGLTSTTVDPRMVFQEALLQKATRIMLCHNHPSGSLRPSNADVNITHKLKAGGKLLDIEVLDHVIVSSEGHFSFKEDGML